MDHFTLLLLDGTVSKDLYGELGHLNLLNYFLWCSCGFSKKKKVRAKMFFSFCLIFFSVDEYSFAHYTTTGVGCVYYHLYYTTKLILKYVKWTVHFNVLYCSHTRVVSALGGQPNPVRNVNWKGLEILKM